MRTAQLLPPPRAPPKATYFFSHARNSRCRGLGRPMVRIFSVIRSNPPFPPPAPLGGAASGLLPLQGLLKVHQLPQNGGQLLDLPGVQLTGQPLLCLAAKAGGQIPQPGVGPLGIGAVPAVLHRPAADGRGGYAEFFRQLPVAPALGVELLHLRPGDVVPSYHSAASSPQAKPANTARA